MLDRIKRWVTRPNGSSAIGPGDSLFGSFVGLFVARIGDADKKIAFRTQTFLPPTRRQPARVNPAPHLPRRARPRGARRARRRRRSRDRGAGSTASSKREPPSRS